tara:strand:+ start:483 stop:665 length:183 start_codon:yes stop_codon:yes gene_type:complete
MKCKHTKKENCYGFAPKPQGFSGPGVYTICTDCYKILDFELDLEVATEEEINLDNKRRGK